MSFGVLNAIAKCGCNPNSFSGQQLCVQKLKGSRAGTVVRALASQQCGPGSIPGLGDIRGFEFVVGSCPCSERFFSRYSGFHLSSKPTFPNFNLIQMATLLNLVLAWCYLL